MCVCVCVCVCVEDSRVINAGDVYGLIVGDCVCAYQFL